MIRLLKIIGALLAGYVLSYVIFRNTNIQTWEKDGNQYVIFPKNQAWVYYLYRPLTYIDSKVTVMRFHIGPHQ
ncbi:MAG: hypothetical protein QM762_24380 [Chryseolinea sp.]